MIGFVTLYLGYSIQSVSNTGIHSKLMSDEAQGDVFKPYDYHVYKIPHDIYIL